MRVLSSFIAVLLLGACVSKGEGDATSVAVEPCTPGRSESCPCPSGAMGIQICGNDGLSFEPCQCTSDMSTSRTGEPTPTSSGPTSFVTGGEITTEDATTSGSETAMTSNATSSGSTDEGTTSTSTSTGVPCSSENEPDDDEQGVPSDDIKVCGDVSKFLGALDTISDVDWYKYYGVHVPGGCGLPFPNPSASVTAKEELRICLFFGVCDGGEQVNVICMEGEEAISPGEKQGCCHQNSVEAVVDCEGVETNDVTVFIRVDQPPSDQCVEYLMQYEYATPR